MRAGQTSAVNRKGHIASSQAAANFKKSSNITILKIEHFMLVIGFLSLGAGGYMMSHGVSATGLFAGGVLVGLCGLELTAWALCIMGHAAKGVGASKAPAPGSHRAPSRVPTAGAAAPPGSIARIFGGEKPPKAPCSYDLQKEIALIKQEILLAKSNHIYEEHAQNQIILFCRELGNEATLQSQKDKMTYLRSIDTDFLLRTLKNPLLIYRGACSNRFKEDFVADVLSVLPKPWTPELIEALRAFSSVLKLVCGEELSLAQKADTMISLLEKMNLSFVCDFLATTPLDKALIEELVRRMLQSEGSKVSEFNHGFMVCLTSWVDETTSVISAGEFKLSLQFIEALKEELTLDVFKNKAHLVSKKMNELD